MSTIVDVARVANVSIATVSRVINAPHKVREETRRQVHDAMTLCNYKYNALARGLATQRSHTIGLIIPTVTNPIFAESVRGVQDHVEASGYRVVLGNSDYSLDTEKKLIQVFREMRVDGLIITTTDLNGPHLTELVEEKVPFVLLYSTVRRGPLSCVGIDNFKGGYRATEHLVSFGHRRIAMLAGNFSFSDKSFHRWHGYRKCLRDRGIKYDAKLLVQTTYTLESGMKAVKQLMWIKRPPTAIFCSNDFLAIGVLEGARDMGLMVPEDLSVVGFDDMPMMAYFKPGLDTIQQPAYDMGKIGSEVLLRRIDNPDQKPVHRILDTQLIVRQSVCSPRRKMG